MRTRIEKVRRGWKRDLNGYRFVKLGLNRQFLENKLSTMQ